MLNKVLPLALLAVLALVAIRQVLSPDGTTRTEVFPSSTTPDESSTIPATSGVDLPDVTAVDLNSRVTVAGAPTQAGSTSTASPTTRLSSTSSSAASSTASPTTSSTTTSLTISLPTITIPTLPTTNITIPTTASTTTETRRTTSSATASTDPPPTGENSGGGAGGGN